MLISVGIILPSHVLNVQTGLTELPPEHLADSSMPVTIAEEFGKHYNTYIHAYIYIYMYAY
jgi:hypothetical protein